MIPHHGYPDLGVITVFQQVNYTLLGEICNLWRNYDDIEDSWESVLGIVDWFFQNQDDLQPVSGPGHWNDPDMVSLDVCLLLLPSIFLPDINI